MNIINTIILKLLTEESLIQDDILIDPATRHLQILPDYTSPPLQIALDATPYKYKSDKAIDIARGASENNICSTLDPAICQILFEPSSEFESFGLPTLGVIFYGGALVDPRGYSPIAQDLANKYGLAVSIPIFHHDIAFSGCSSDRLELASLAFPSVEKWVMVGHSMGGIGVMSEIWTALSHDSDNELTQKIGGMGLIASYVRQDVGCGAVDFSNHTIPVVSISATLDGVINNDRFNAGQLLLPNEYTFSMAIQGANHGNFGGYDYEGRRTILIQNDGEALIPAKIQQDLTVSAIMQVVSRTGLPLPVKKLKGVNKKKKIRINAK